MTDYMMIPPESRLDMIGLAEGLTRAGRLSAKDLVRLKSMRQMRLTPLPFLAEQKLPDLRAPGEVLDMAALLDFLSQETGQGVFDIDPLKIDSKAVAEVMSEAFAERHQIL
ncbi:MAG: type II/IV secretion system protein, partial [Halieaceae bacterium]|nr:type II/IV secretion system protein [Halieaceae bacterium]